ncbi:cysteine-rich receptor-like protein kinase 43 [Triticum urartu]|uniref:cysteine-rich receptor-like protein kinase 43 n=1 Tax=Triticum urartu TaxID=4572 RepID=UPI0020431A62|nr:cysteine-rich receptor-like protein kinase 43 [Triticum urartu]
MPNGSLYKYITVADAPSALDWQTRCKIIEGISFGLRYLHEGSNVPIIHLDLKPANILLDEDFVPKITDFGLSRLFDPQQTIDTAAATGTLGYMSPEYQLRGKITPMADIFSLGVIIMEIITGHRDYPYDIRKSSKDFIKQEMQKWRNKLQKEPGYTLEIDCQQIERYIQIGLICVNNDRSKRPTMKKIIDMLQGVESMNCYIRNELSIDDIQEEL